MRGRLVILLLPLEKGGGGRGEENSERRLEKIGTDPSLHESIDPRLPATW